jgi:hypothetical protein
LTKLDWTKARRACMNGIDEIDLKIGLPNASMVERAREIAVEEGIALYPRFNMDVRVCSWFIAQHSRPQSQGKGTRTGSFEEHARGPREHASCSEKASHPSKASEEAKDISIYQDTGEQPNGGVSITACKCGAAQKASLPRARIIAGGGVQMWPQCLRCGGRIGSGPVSKARARHMSGGKAIEPFDLALLRRGGART